MANVNEIFTKAVGHMRAIMGDTVTALKKGNKEITDKLDQLDKNDDIVKGIKGVEDAVKSQKAAESIKIENPEAITGDLKKGLEGIIETLKAEVKNFDKEVVVKNDLSQLATLFKSSQDKKSILSALGAIESKMGETTDYTLILSDIANVLENNKEKEILETLKKVLLKEYNVSFPEVMPVDLDPNLIEDHRVKTVLPDEQVKAMSAIATTGANIRLVVEALKEQTERLSESTSQMNTNNDLLRQVLLENKITNIHQKSMTDEDVLDADVEIR